MSNVLRTRKYERVPLDKKRLQSANGCWDVRRWTHTYKYRKVYFTYLPASSCKFIVSSSLYTTISSPSMWQIFENGLISILEYIHSSPNVYKSTTNINSKTGWFHRKIVPLVQWILKDKRVQYVSVHEKVSLIPIRFHAKFGMKWRFRF